MKPSSTILRAVALASMLAALASPGCFWAPELSSVRSDLEHQLPGASFDKNVEFSCGPVLLTLARTVTSIIPGAREARPYLSGVSHVEIGVYDAHVDSLTDVRMPRRLQTLIDEGWETAVRVRDNHEAAWLLYRPDGDEVKEIFVVVLDRDELVLVRARGHMEKLVEAALESARGHESFHRALHG
jgi:hypothetical protein